VDANKRLKSCPRAFSGPDDRRVVLRYPALALRHVIGRLDLGDINLAPACRFISQPEKYPRLGAACERAIKAADTEIELELSAGRPRVRLHRQCFAIWREECGHQ
jgi:hypothetical protein